MRKVVVLFSGGKDSTYATFWAMSMGFDVVLLTVKPEEYSMVFHHPNVKWTKIQAEAIGLKIEYIEEKGEKLERVKEKIKEMAVEGIVTGALESEYQKQKIDRIGEELGIPTYSPLWHKGETIMEDVIKYFETYFSSVSAEGMGKELLGEKIKKIKGVHIAFEGGEAETFVADAPFFRKRIKINEWKKRWDGIRGVAEIKDAHLVDKG